ncbi:hypothetical protein [Ornithinimicrobium cryptoxanthini]|uniref:hypothetical protein n=1 Tax=Ornithinimicrobium cryptoxanthini TaxID=2934161 RepID=UPI0021182FE0|nr:hypothetical protein [Ornithinimicrobium cryptoxanthini]
MRQPTPARAVWVWDEPVPGELAAWAQAAGVLDLFVATPVRWGGTSRLSWVRDVHAHLGGRVGLQALGGDPGWLDEPGEARTWLQTAQAAALFDGVHLDLEPWGHPGWDHDREDVVRRYLGLLEELVTASVLPVEVDVSFWLHQVEVPAEPGVPGRGRLLDAVLDLVPTVTVLAYRRAVTGPDSITELARPTVVASRERGRRCRVGLETRDLRPHPVADKQTFFGRPRAELDAAMGEVETLLGGWSGWGGLAVHDRAGWVALPADRTPQ